MNDEAERRSGEPGQVVVDDAIKFLRERPENAKPFFMYLAFGKLIRYPQVNVTHLFDLQADPDEMHNLADQPAHRERVQSMLARLAEVQPTWDDTAPLTVSNSKPAAWSLPTESE